MAPIKFELTSNNVWKLTNDELMVAIQEAQKRSLLDNFKKKEKSEKAEDKKSWELLLSYLKNKILSKPNMSPTDKENMKKSIKYLVDNKIYTSGNLEKLNAINYGTNFIEIGGVKFSREKLIPKEKFKPVANQYGVFESKKEWIFKSKKEHIFKTNYNGKDEYYLSTDAYIKEAKKQGKKVIKDEDIRKALACLPTEFEFKSDYKWCGSAYILWNILNLSMSGYVTTDGKWWEKDNHGYLSSASPSPVYEYDVRALSFNNYKGGLDNNHNRFTTNPCLYIVE